MQRRSLGLPSPPAGPPPADHHAAGYIAVCTGTLGVAGQHHHSHRPHPRSRSDDDHHLRLRRRRQPPRRRGHRRRQHVSAVNTPPPARQRHRHHQPTPQHQRLRRQRRGHDQPTAGPSNVANGSRSAPPSPGPTAGAGGMSGGSLGITVPAGWTAPPHQRGRRLRRRLRRHPRRRRPADPGHRPHPRSRSDDDHHLRLRRRRQPPRRRHHRRRQHVSAVKHSTTGIGSAITTPSPRQHQRVCRGRQRHERCRAHVRGRRLDRQHAHLHLYGHEPAGSRPARSERRPGRLDGPADRSSAAPAIQLRRAAAARRVSGVAGPVKSRLRRDPRRGRHDDCYLRRDRRLAAARPRRPPRAQRRPGRRSRSRRRAGHSPPSEPRRA